MTMMLWMLFWAVILTFVQMFVAVIGANGQFGLTTLAGNRAEMGPLTGWAGRAERAYRNMLEALPLFIALVLIAHLAGAKGGNAAFGAQVFVYARLVYAVVYVIGIPWLRTAVWAVSVVGLALIVAGIAGLPAAG